MLPHIFPQDILLRRAADVLEAFYSLPRAPHTSTGPLNHISPLYYPRSPAIFTPAIIAQQGFTPRFGPPGFSLISPGPGKGFVNLEARRMQSEGGSGVGYQHSNPVSRCSSDGTDVQNQPHPSGMDSGINSSPSQVFTFPSVESMTPEIKSEHMPPPTSAPMPYIQVTHPGNIHGHYSGHQGMVPMSSVHSAFMGAPGGEGSNRNNNNSTHSIMENLGVNPIQLIPKIVPTLPPSPGYLMAHTGSKPLDA